MVLLEEAIANTQPVVIGALTLAFVLMSFVIHRIFLGRNWARLIFAAIVAVGMLGSVPEMLQTARTLPINAAINAAVLGIQLVALVFLFLPQSREWFRRRTGQRVDV